MGLFDFITGRNDRFDSAKVISLYNSNKYEEALIECEKGIKQQPTNIKLQKLKGKCLQIMKRPDEAFAIYQTILKSSLNEPEIQFAIFSCLYELDRKIPALLAFLNALAEQDEEAIKLIKDGHWTFMVLQDILDEIKSDNLTKEDAQTLLIIFNHRHKEFWNFVQYTLAKSILIYDIIETLEIILPDWLSRNSKRLIDLAYTEIKADRRENAETISEYLMERLPNEEDVQNLSDYLSETDEN